MQNYKKDQNLFKNENYITKKLGSQLEIVKKQSDRQNKFSTFVNHMVKPIS